MAIEIEASFPDINKETVRNVLREQNATCRKPERLMRRKVYNPRDKDRDWFRVRDEGDRVTMSYKKLHDRTVDGVTEYTVEVNDFDEACQLLEQTGVIFVAYQDTRRESWRLDGADIEIDEWPWIPPFVEIEGESKEAVRCATEKIGFSWKEAVFGSVENMYQRHYAVTDEEVDTWPEITFSEIPDWLEQKRR